MTIELPIYNQGRLDEQAGTATYNPETREFLIDLEWQYWNWYIMPMWKQITQSQNEGIAHREVIKIDALMVFPKYHGGVIT